MGSMCPLFYIRLLLFFSTCNEPPTTSSEISNAFTGTLVADSSNQATETESHERDGATLLNAETGSSHEEMSEIPVCDGKQLRARCHKEFKVAT